MLQEQCTTRFTWIATKKIGFSPSSFYYAKTLTAAQVTVLLTDICKKKFGGSANPYFEILIVRELAGTR